MHPSSTVQLPFAAWRGAQVPQLLFPFSQWPLMHCRLAPQPPPLTVGPGTGSQAAGRLLARRPSHVAIFAASAQAAM